MMFNCISALLLLTTICGSAFACQPLSNNSTPVIYFPAKLGSEHPKEDYIFQLLQLVINKSEVKYGPCVVEFTLYQAPLKRMQYYLESGRDVDVIALTVSQERDQNLLPIKVPIAKGLVGYRLLMINTNNANRFNNINSLKQLKKFVAGQGTDWPDVTILQQNDLPVVTSGSVKTLVQMLAHNRFDYFPQGALQIGRVLDNYRNKTISIAENVLISYPSMTAFYVNKGNKKLAERLEYGLKQAYLDGSFNYFFEQHPLTLNAANYLKLHKKKILFLCNKNLSKWAPIANDAYWLRPWSSDVKNCSIQLEQTM